MVDVVESGDVTADVTEDVVECPLVALVMITFIDLDIWEVPDEISLPSMAIGAVLHPVAFGGPWWGGRQFTVADPEGNWWTVYEAGARVCCSASSTGSLTPGS